jgi:hypothetical protein
VVELATHVQQSRKKRTSPNGYAIITFFGGTNPYKKMMNNNNNFWWIWCYIFVRVTSPCPLVRIFGFKG